MANQWRDGWRETVRADGPHEPEAVIAQAYLPDLVAFGESPSETLPRD